MKRFEDIKAWARSKDLTLNIYSLLRGCSDFGFKDQIERASVSIMNNIAEGFERDGNREFRRFLFIAKGSAGEVRSMLVLGGELGYFKSIDINHLIVECEDISKMLSGLIKKL